MKPTKEQAFAHTENMSGPGIGGGRVVLRDEPAYGDACKIVKQRVGVAAYPQDRGKASLYALVVTNRFLYRRREFITPWSFLVSEQLSV
jgi:hypothetical protein